MTASLETLKQNIRAQLTDDVRGTFIVIHTPTPQKLPLLRHACGELDEEFKKFDVTPILMCEGNSWMENEPEELPKMEGYSIAVISFILACEALEKLSSKTSINWRKELTNQSVKLFDSMSIEELEQFLKKAFPSNPE